MDTQSKRGAIQKKMNEYTQQVTPGQMAKIGPTEVNHLHQVYLGRPATASEMQIYMNHPDSKMLEKHLSMKRKDSQPPKEIQGSQGYGGGQGGLTNPMTPTSSFQNLGNYMGSVGDPNGNIPNFHDALAQGISAIGNTIGSAFSVPLTKTASNLWGNIKSAVTGQGFRTDRHNNPAAFTTDVAKTAGLVPGVDYLPGDTFSNGKYRTAKLLGNPINQTIKVIDRIGFYTQGGKPRWSYVSSLPGISNWKNMDTNQKANVIALMYKHEGGSGSLMKGGAGGGKGGGRVAQEFQNLGNITTNYGESTRDEPFHAAIDVANRKGTPIPEFKGGVVTQVGQHPDYGNFVKVKDNQGNTQQYSHLHRTTVRPGQQVQKNQMIGEMGDSGNTYSPGGGDPSHLHYSVSDMYNQSINPNQYL